MTLLKDEAIKSHVIFFLNGGVMIHQKIDQQALKISKEFRQCEAELLDIIIKVDELKVYRKFGYPSLFQYVVKRLELSEAQADNSH
jgi:hypothetical protein